VGSFYYPMKTPYGRDMTTLWTKGGREKGSIACGVIAVYSPDGMQARKGKAGPGD